MDSVKCVYLLSFFLFLYSECMMYLRHQLCWGVMDSDLCVLLFWEALLEAQTYATTSN